MSRMEKLLSRRGQLLDEVASLDQIRRGSIVEQFVEATCKDGRRVRRGPYFLHTFKEKGRTISRRLKTPQEVKRCQRQIRGFRRFKELVGELVRIGEELSDVVHEEAVRGEEWSVEKKRRVRGGEGGGNRTDGENDPGR